MRPMVLRTYVSNYFEMLTSQMWSLLVAPKKPPLPHFSSTVAGKEIYAPIFVSITLFSPLVFVFNPMYKSKGQILE